ncbi:MAG: TonB-dependent receptor [Flammeovirgaceae bacterium]|nr:TonB-dependent receptor [Flammeovirgaceae bacterium]
MKNPVHFAFILVLLVNLNLQAQSPTQTVRGTVVDKISQSSLPGASVVIMNSNPLVGTTTDPDGNFKLERIPVGTHTLRVSFIGYKDITIPNVTVNSGKEVVLTLSIEEDITQLNEIVVRPDLEKNKPINEMATVSTRTFSVEETRKFAAAVNDPARAAVSFAGVVSTDDGNNSISIRGNSPTGLLWRMEGVDIPNPNHFADVASSGGGISILSTQLLSNSDFSTGAFAAEYGNALAGVFDLNLRKGNNEKREYTVQAGFLGLDVAAEGPFSKNYRGSYLINYRYSTLSVLSNLGLNVGDAVTNFQDLSYNIYLPTKKLGNFSLFGFGGLSDQNQNAKKDSTLWEEDYQRYDYTYFSNTGVTGLKHTITLNLNTFLQTTVLFSGHNYGDQEDRLDNNYNPQFNYKSAYTTKRITLASVINNKLNAKNNLRSGVYLKQYAYNLTDRYLDKETNQIEEPLNSTSHARTLQAFSQWSYRPIEKLTLNSGVHLLFLNDNKTFSVEPRISAQYNVSEKQSISMGYGLHSQMQSIGVYQAQIQQENGILTQPNLNLGFNKAHHFVLAFDRSLTKYLRVKAETYYQQLFNVAVENDITSPVSSLVVEDGYATVAMVNEGVGKNYGVELTIEQFLHNNLYFLFSGSLYNSQYKALDDVWRNTKFNGNHALSFTAGKDYPLKKNRTFGLNLRTIYTGGFWTTPIDYEKSVEFGETRYVESLAFTEQLPDYFRMDLKLSLKRNRPHATTTLALDIQNVTNQKNLGGQYYDAQSGKTEKWYMLPLLPILSYRIEF